MVDGRYNSAFKRNNIRTLRRALKMTQKEFIDYFLCKRDDKPLMSIATLSNLESKGGERVNEVVSSVCAKLQIDTMLFSLNPDEFMKEIEKYLAEHKENEELLRGIEKKGSISKLVNRLTMYFADEGSRELEPPRVGLPPGEPAGGGHPGARRGSRLDGGDEPRRRSPEIGECVGADQGERL